MSHPTSVPHEEAIAESPTSVCFRISSDSSTIAGTHSGQRPQRLDSNSFTAFRAVPRTTIKLPTREGTLFGSDPTCIPPVTAHRRRTLVLCFDGTGDQFDSDISNIAKIFTMLKKDDKAVQMVYYQAGIGTQLNRHISSRLVRNFNKALDEAVATYLSVHVKEGYEFLMQNYTAGDKVCLFGFSRGAYTARALAGMLHKVGLLPADNRQQIPFAWRMFKDTSHKGWELSRQFKDGFCSDVNVDFLGCFDTVSSVGVLFGRRLPFAGSNHGVCYFRHAMALDERRARFKVNHWGKVEEQPDKDSYKRKKKVRKGYEHTWHEPDDVDTDVKEVWFSGGHCDVGGGNVPNDTKYVAANIPLRWMIRECFRCETGIIFDIYALHKIGLAPDQLFPEVIIPKPPSSISSSPAGSTCDGVENVKGERVYEEDDHELRDTEAQLFDQLSIAKGWWVLEFLPTRGRKHIVDDKWKEHYFLNFGKGRIVPNLSSGMNVHRSVKMRLEKGDYVTKAIYDCEPNWVD